MPVLAILLQWKILSSGLLSGETVSHWPRISLMQCIAKASLEFCVMTWVASDWNLSDALMKAADSCRKPLELFLKTRRWRVKFDPEFVVAAKKSVSARAQMEQEAVATDSASAVIGTLWQDDLHSRSGVPDLDELHRRMLQDARL